MDYVNGKDGLLMAPTYAVPRLLARNGLSLQDFDFYEIHEAFASVVLAHLQAWESEEYCKERLGLDAALGSIDRSKLNVNGSSLAAGHPFAATGGRIVAQLAKQLGREEKGNRSAGSRADLHLRRRWAGRHRHSGGLTRRFDAGVTAPRSHSIHRIAPCCRLTPRPDGNTGHLLGRILYRFDGPGAGRRQRRDFHARFLARCGPRPGPRWPAGRHRRRLPRPGTRAGRYGRPAGWCR